MRTLLTANPRFQKASSRLANGDPERRQRTPSRRRESSRRAGGAAASRPASKLCEAGRWHTNLSAGRSPAVLIALPAHAYPPRCSQFSFCQQERLVRVLKAERIPATRVARSCSQLDATSHKSPGRNPRLGSEDR